GKMRKWEAVERTTGADIVSVIPVTDNGKIILIKQFRPPVGRMVIEFPAGLRDEGENLQVSALRELQEETGYQAGEIRKLFAGPVSAGLSSEFLTVFLATDLKFVGKKDGREERGIEVYEVPFAEADEWLDGKEQEGALVDIKMRASLSYVRNILGG
ncbi:MAG: NUDIX hydrolase, partial [Candidatus Pacebacteria bacterium]|nr:NUDIX hydrolase [Candidatus Paceibacterota bacterium]